MKLQQKKKRQKNLNTYIMQKKDCFLFGTVFKLHGYKGDVNIYNDDDIPFDFSKLTYFLIEQNNELVPYFIEQARATKPNVVLVKFEDIDGNQMNFPSKLFRYLPYGKPILSTNTQGLSPDYSNALIYVDFENVDSFSQKTST